MLILLSTVSVGMQSSTSAQSSAQDYEHISNILDRITAKKHLPGKSQMYRSADDYSRQTCLQYLSRYPQYRYLIDDIRSKSLITSANNELELLINGEQKFPLLLQDLREAKDHIHLQYYIIETEGIAARIADILKRKAGEGVEVRFLYDAFGSKFIPREYLQGLRDAGVQVAGYLRLDPMRPWRTLNNRNHRKIVVIDGSISYLGGLNLADRYINTDTTQATNRYFWRDTHMRLEGGATQSLQYVFLGDWNFATNEEIPYDDTYFPSQVLDTDYGHAMVQTLSSGPETEDSDLLEALLQIIRSSKQRLLLATPYFIPNRALVRELKDARRRGVDVQLMIPGLTDALLVNSVARSYYRTLIKSGVELLEYQKGFIHSKTLVSDEDLAVISSANLDRRSFFINFEVSAFVYNPKFATSVADVFMEDKKHCRKLVLEDWNARPSKQMLYEYTTRVFAPLF